MFTFLWISDNTAINSLTALAHQTHNPLSICHKQYILGALASSLNCLLLSSCPSDRLFATLFLSVRPSVCVNYQSGPTARISVQSIMEIFMKICPGNRNLVKIGQYYWTLYMKTETHFIFFGHIKSP